MHSQPRLANCYTDNVCWTSSPNFLVSGGPVSQCNADSQCPTYSPDIGSLPTLSCRDDLKFYDYWCSDVNYTILNATAQGAVGPAPKCVPQPFSFKSQSFDSCYGGSNRTGGSVQRMFGCGESISQPFVSNLYSLIAPAPPRTIRVVVSKDSKLTYGSWAGQRNIA